MSRFPPIVQVLAAGSVAGLISSLLFLLADLAGVFDLLGVSMGAPANPMPWLLQKVVEYALFALLFLIPVLTTDQWKRGLVFGLAPAARLWFITFPAGGFGLFGIELGLGVPVSALVFNLFWGALTGWLLERFDPGWAVETREEA